MNNIFNYKKTKSVSKKIKVTIGKYNRTEIKVVSIFATLRKKGDDLKKNKNIVINLKN